MGNLGFLCSCTQHIFNKNAIAGGGVVDEDMGNRSHKVAGLNNG